ncbi:MAG: sigma-70 family RNA polymerase sigma factor [Vicinamibacterales bacterium]
MNDDRAAAPAAAPPVDDATLDTLYTRSGAARWGLTREAFTAGVLDAFRARWPGPGQANSLVLLTTHHPEDLGLAVACAEGLPDAWDHFVLTYRPELYRAARAMTDDATGRELADSLYADLYGLGERDGRRRSLFRYYHGRAKLSTWLRSVLAQRHVDLVRARKRTVSLDDDAARPAETRLAAPDRLHPADAATMRAAAGAVTAALGVLSADDRRLIAWYYVHGVTLAAIGQASGVSEATASRRLERVRRALRTAIERELEARRMSITDVDDWAAVARQSWDAALADALGVGPPQESGAPTFTGKRTP